MPIYPAVNQIQNISLSVPFADSRFFFLSLSLTMHCFYSWTYLCSGAVIFLFKGKPEQTFAWVQNNTFIGHTPATSESRAMSWGPLKREKNIRFLLWSDMKQGRQKKEEKKSKKNIEIVILAKEVCEGSFIATIGKDWWWGGVVGADGVVGRKATCGQQKWWLSFVPTHTRLSRRTQMHSKNTRHRKWHCLHFSGCTQERVTRTPLEVNSTLSPWEELMISFRRVLLTVQLNLLNSADGHCFRVMLFMHFPADIGISVRTSRLEQVVPLISSSPQLSCCSNWTQLV